MGRGNRHGYDPYMYAMILWHWNLVDRRCDRNDTCEPCADGGASVKTRWTKNLDWTFERLQGGRLKEVFNRIHKPSHHLPVTVTHQAGANIRRYLQVRNEYCREKGYTTPEQCQQFAVPSTREKALEMIAVVDKRNKRTKARPRRAQATAPKPEAVVQEQTQAASEQLPEASDDLTEQLSQTSVAEAVQDVRDTEEEPDSQVEMVPAEARQQSTLDSFVDQYVPAETLQTMQTTATDGSSQTRSAKSADTPTRSRTTRARFNKPENPDVKSCNTPQLGVAKTTAPDTRGFSKVGPILVQSPSQTRATRMDRTRRRNREEAAKAEPDDDVSLLSVAALPRAPLRPSDVRGRRHDVAQASNLAPSQTVTAALAEEAARLEQSRGAGSAPTSITIDAMARAIQGVAVGAAKHIKETTSASDGCTKAQASSKVKIRMVKTTETGQTDDVLMDAALTIGESPECDRATIVVSGKAATSQTLFRQAAQLGVDLYDNQSTRSDLTPVTAQQRSAENVDSYANVDDRHAFNDTMSTEGYEDGIPVSPERRVLTTDDEHDDVDEHYATASEGADRADDDVQALEQPMDTSEAPAATMSTLPDVVTPTSVAEQVLQNVQALSSAWATGDTTVAPPVAPSPVETPEPSPN